MSGTGEKVTSNNANHSAPVNDFHVYIHTPERKNTGRVRSEVDNVMVTVKTRVHDAILTAMESLISSRVELAMKSVNAFSGRDRESAANDSL